MNDKPFWKSKEIWLGLVIIGSAVAKKFGIEIPTQYILGALGLDLTLARIRQGNTQSRD